MTAPRPHTPRASRLRPGAAALADPPSRRAAAPVIPSDLTALRDVYLAQRSPSRLVARVRSAVRGPARRKRMRVAALATALLSAFVTGWIGGALGSQGDAPGFVAAARVSAGPTPGPALPSNVDLSRDARPLHGEALDASSNVAASELLTRLVASAATLPRPDSETLEAWERLTLHADPRVRDAASALLALAGCETARQEVSPMR